MAITTKIEYADSSLNLTMGCDGCELWNKRTRLCYAGRITEKYAGRPGWPVDFQIPTVFPERLNLARKWSDLTGMKRPDKPWLNLYPRVIFLNDMGDTFSSSLPIEYFKPLADELARTPHIYLILTKRPSLALRYAEKYGEYPPNFWIGTTVTGNLSKVRLSTLARIPAAVKWVSLEPLLDPVDLPYDTLSAIQWAVIGGLSMSKQFTPAAWLLDTVRQCRNAGLHVFFKQWGSVSSNPNWYDQTAIENGGKTKGGCMIDGNEIKEMPDWIFIPNLTQSQSRSGMSI